MESVITFAKRLIAVKSGCTSGSCVMPPLLIMIYRFCRKTTLTKHARKHPHGDDGFLAGSAGNSDDDEWASEVEEAVPAMNAAVAMSRPASSSYYGDHWRLPTRHLQHMHQSARFDRSNRPVKLERSISANSHQDQMLAKIEEAPSYDFSQTRDRILPTLMSVRTSIAPDIHTAPVTSTFSNDITTETLNSPDTLTNSSNGFSNFPTPTSARSQSGYLGQAGYPSYSLSGDSLRMTIATQQNQHIQSPHGNPETMISPMEQLVSRSGSVSETPAAMDMTTQSSQAHIGYSVDESYLGQDYREPQLVMNQPAHYQLPVPNYPDIYGSVPPTWYTNIKPEETWPGLLPNDRIQQFSG